MCPTDGKINGIADSTKGLSAYDNAKTGASTSYCFTEVKASTYALDEIFSASSYRRSDIGLVRSVYFLL